MENSTTSRLPMVPTDPDNEDLAKTFDWVRDKGIEVPVLYRILGNSPILLKAWVDFAWTLRLNATTPRDLRELMIMRGAQLQGIEYEWAHHWSMAIAAGVPEEKLRALGSWQDSRLFDQREKLVLALTDEIAGGSGATEQTINGLREHFDDGAIIELLLTASFYVCVSRMLNSIGINLEADFRQYVDASFKAR